MAWARTVRRLCGIISHGKTQALEITGCILHEARVKTTVQREGWVSFAGNKPIGHWINGSRISGSMGFLLQAIDTPSYFGSEKGQGLSLGSGKFSSPLGGQRAVGAV